MIMTRRIIKYCIVAIFGWVNVRILIIMYMEIYIAFVFTFH